MEDYRGQVAECFLYEDFMKNLGPAIYAKEGRDEMMKELEEKHVADFLKKFETLLSDDRRFLCNDTLSTYDILTSGFFINLVLNPNSADPELWARVWETVPPKTKKFVAAVQDEFKDYLAKRADIKASM
eukprot:CAMPEP_0168613474 /NCGR_PEP_ID=MMETSP0449_2-20121227/3469_1 /TAXON_ID=1082188 /ORGANISM="Strombidium rassoulzadegani, Strain ras09" /LENGTH=128 /DNA_ID=CAMNT_0008654107 /DNA_START=181 /DNA_END=567 /DNA_ORIENTATION=-